MGQSDYTEYILRFSYGKDSFKCLDVIHTRGLPLDRITTTDVWATDTIPAWLPPMTAFKDRMDEWIWSKYRLEVEHLCARNLDGSKRTYEQMFYHIPNRRSQDVQVERERETPAGSNPRLPGIRGSLVSIYTQAQFQVTGYREPSPDSQYQSTVGHGASSSNLPQGSIKGWPLSNGKLTWCQKLKHRYSKRVF